MLSSKKIAGNVRGYAMFHHDAAEVKCGGAEAVVGSETTKRCGYFYEADDFVNISHSIISLRK